MNIVLVAHNFPPDRYVGAFRAAKVAEALRTAGHHVDVITARGSPDEGRLRVDEQGLRVHTVPVIPHPRELYVWGKHRLRRDGAVVHGGSEGGESSDALPDREDVPVWKRLILSSLWIPDDLQGFILPAIARALPLVRKGADMIYTTAPPFSDHLVGLLLKALTHVQWVAEFRDPWTDNPERPLRVRSRPADAINRWLERRCLANADRVVAVAESTAELLAAKMPPSRRDRLVLALNGIDRIDPEVPAPTASRPFHIVYTGTFHGGRDPRPFLAALAALVKRRGLGADDLQVELIGRSRRYHSLSVERLASDLGIGDLVRFIDWLPQETARDHMRRADLLLLFFRGHRIQIPNKLYDYLGVRRPILALADPDAEVTRMLQRVGGHYVVTDDDASSLELALETALRRRNEPFAGSEELLREWSSDVQLEHLLTSIGVPTRGSAEPARSREPAAAALRSA